MVMMAVVMMMSETNYDAVVMMVMMTVVMVMAGADPDRDLGDLCSRLCGKPGVIGLQQR